MQLNVLDTERMAAKYRAAAIDLTQQRLRVTRYTRTLQEQDLSVPANCAGFGRIHHFRRQTPAPWPANPLPMDPARRALGLPPTDTLRVQVFQNAVCDWRCWYCFVPFNMLTASPSLSSWMTAEELVDLFLAEPDRPSVIDLSGGQPDLTPEWIPWMMKALRQKGIERQVYLWSDDNLSSDFFWRYLSDAERELVATYPLYGRVCCFKGFDEESFAFNTQAAPNLFARQFELIGRLINFGIDVYAYVTFTSGSELGIGKSIERFIDRLQAVDPYLPLRTVPLEIKVFSPVKGRMNELRYKALETQRLAVDAWCRGLERRFSAADLQRSVVDVPVGPQGRK